MVSVSKKSERPCPVVIHSGGAYGADLIFEEVAIALDVSCNVFTFKGHMRRVPEPGIRTRTILSPQLAIANPWLCGCAKIIGRRPPNFTAGSAFTAALLQRNYWIVQAADILLALGHFRSKESLSRETVELDEIQGGTAWGCGMFAMKMLGVSSQAGAHAFSVPVDSKSLTSVRKRLGFFYNVASMIWYEFIIQDGRVVLNKCTSIKSVLDKLRAWIPELRLIDLRPVIIAGIGTRDLPPIGFTHATTLPEKHPKTLITDVLSAIRSAMMPR